MQGSTFINLSDSQQINVTVTVFLTLRQVSLLEIPFSQKFQRNLLENTDFVGIQTVFRKTRKDQKVMYCLQSSAMAHVPWLGRKDTDLRGREGSWQIANSVGNITGLLYRQ